MAYTPTTTDESPASMSSSATFDGQITARSDFPYAKAKSLAIAALVEHVEDGPLPWLTKVAILHQDSLLLSETDDYRAWLKDDRPRGAQACTVEELERRGLIAAENELDLSGRPLTRLIDSMDPTQRSALASRINSSEQPFKMTVKRGHQDQRQMSRSMQITPDAHLTTSRYLPMPCTAAVDNSYAKAYRNAREDPDNGSLTPRGFSVGIVDFPWKESVHESASALKKALIDRFEKLGEELAAHMYLQDMMTLRGPPEVFKYLSSHEMFSNAEDRATARRKVTAGSLNSELVAYDEIGKHWASHLNAYELAMVKEGLKDCPKTVFKASNYEEDGKEDLQ